MKTTTQSLFSEACIIRDATLTIEDKISGKKVEYRKGELRECEVSYNDFEILSFFSLNDQGDTQNFLNISQDVRVTLFLLDLKENYYRREFQIVSDTKNVDLTNKTYTLFCQDIVSYTLSKLYIAKTYKNKKLSDIFQDIFNQYIKNKLSSSQKIELDIESNITIENFVLTPQKSVLNFIKEECDRQGLCFYQDKKKIVMKPYKKLKPDSLELKKEKYNDYKTNPIDPLDILSYRQNKTNTSFKIPKSQVLAYDKSNKTMKIMKQNLEDLGFDVAKEAQDNEGLEYITQEYLYDDNLFAETYKSFLNSSEIEIVVPGFVDVPEIFKKYNVLFKSQEASTSFEGDVKKSGEYILKSYVDKITSTQYYISKLTLCRFKDTENK